MLLSKKRMISIVASLLSFSLVSIGQASAADQTIYIDLNEFQQDATVLNSPTYNIYGVTDNDRITVNVTNSTGGFLGYINKSAGSSINVVAPGVNATSPTGQFYFPEDVTSLALGEAITGSYQINIVVGATAQLTTCGGPCPADSGVAIYTTDFNNAAGFLALGWPMNNPWKNISLVTSGTPRVSLAPRTPRTPNALRLDTQGTTTEKNNVVSCSPGKYTFLNGGSTPETAKIQSYVYTLLVNGKAVSTLSSDAFNSVASHLFPTIAGNMAGTATLEGASWELKGMSNYSASCQVYATQSGGNIQSVTNTAHDAVALAAQAEAATAAQKTKDMITNWASTNEELAKKYRDNRLAGKP